MTMNDAVPAGAWQGLFPCPRCGQGDALAAIPAMHGAASAAEEIVASARSVLRDDDASLSRKAAARQRLAVTAQPELRSADIAPRPAQRGALPLMGAVFFGAGSVIAGLGAGTQADNSTSSGTSFSPAGFHDAHQGGSGAPWTLIAVALAVAAALCLAGLARGIVHNRRVKAGLPAAEAVWRRGWYCRRCAVVFFQPTEEPVGITQGQLLSPGEFRQLVWTIGGYPRH